MVGNVKACHVDYSNIGFFVGQHNCSGHLVSETTARKIYLHLYCQCGTNGLALPITRRMTSITGDDVEDIAVPCNTFALYSCTTQH